MFLTLAKFQQNVSYKDVFYKKTCIM